jgi:hypothetical protein
MYTFKGIQSHTISLEDQTAVVVVPDAAGAGEEAGKGGEGTPSYEEVLAKIKKTGKEVKRGEVDGVEREV